MSSGLDAPSRLWTDMLAAYGLVTCSLFSRSRRRQRWGWGRGHRAVLCCGSRGTLPDGLHGVLWGRNDRAGLLLQDGGPKAVLEHRNRRVQGFQANGLTHLIERAVQAADPTGSILKLIELEVKGDCILGLNRDIRVLVLESGQ